MRMDVKLGVAISLFVVLLAGGYYVYRDKQEKPIPVGRSAPTVAMKQPKSGPATRASTAKSPAKRTPSAKNGSGTMSAKTASSGGTAARGQTSTPLNSAVADRRSSNSGRPAGNSSQRNSATGRGKSTNPQAQRQAARTGGATRPKTTSAKQATKVASSKTGDNIGSAEKASPRRVGPSGSGAATSGEAAPGKAARSRTVLADGSKPSKTNGSGRPPSVTGARKSRPVPTSSAAARGGSGGETSNKDNSTSRRNGAFKPSSAVAVDTHKVQQGDTVASLAKMYYGDEKHTAFLMASNPQILDARRLRVGMSIKLPSIDDGLTGSDEKQQSASNTYQVQPGDTFYGIARDKLGDSSRWQELFDLNKSLVHGDPTRLRPGQVIDLPKS